MSASRPVHERRTTGTEEDDEIDPMVDQQGCGKVYAKLEVSLPKICSFTFYSGRPPFSICCMVVAISYNTS